MCIHSRNHSWLYQKSSQCRHLWLVSTNPVWSEGAKICPDQQTKRVSRNQCGYVCTEASEMLDWFIDKLWNARNAQCEVDDRSCSLIWKFSGSFIRKMLLIRHPEKSLSLEVFTLLVSIAAALALRMSLASDSVALFSLRAMALAIELWIPRVRFPSKTTGLYFSGGVARTFEAWSETTLEAKSIGYGPGNEESCAQSLRAYPVCLQ